MQLLKPGYVVEKNHAKKSAKPQLLLALLLTSGSQVL